MADERHKLSFVDIEGDVVKRGGLLASVVGVDPVNVLDAKNLLACTHEPMTPFCQRSALSWMRLSSFVMSENRMAIMAIAANTL